MYFPLSFIRKTYSTIRDYFEYVTVLFLLLFRKVNVDIYKSERM